MILLIVFVHKNPTRFLEELCQNIIIWFLLVLGFIVFHLLSLKGPFLHQVRDAVAFEPHVLSVFAFLMFVFVRVGRVAVLPLFPVFLWARQGWVFVSVLVRAGGGWFFDCWLGNIPISVILSCVLCIYRNIRLHIHAILVGALTVCRIIWFTLRVFTAWGSVSIFYCRSVSCGVSVVGTAFILVCGGVFTCMVYRVWMLWSLRFLGCFDIRTCTYIRIKQNTLR